MKNSHVQKTILVVDEEKGNISLLDSMLAAENHHIFNVTDGALALDKSLNSISNGHSMLTEKKGLALCANPLNSLASPTGFEPVLPA
jgi:CheY-like chemotaxis protein